MSRVLHLPCGRRRPVVPPGRRVRPHPGAKRRPLPYCCCLPGLRTEAFRSCNRGDDPANAGAGLAASGGRGARGTANPYGGRDANPTPGPALSCCLVVAGLDRSAVTDTADRRGATTGRRHYPVPCAAATRRPASLSNGARRTSPPERGRRSPSVAATIPPERAASLCKP